MPATHERSPFTQHLGGEPVLLTRKKPQDLLARAALLKAGAFDFDGTLTIGSQWHAVRGLLTHDLQRMDCDQFRSRTGHPKLAAPARHLCSRGGDSIVDASMMHPDGFNVLIFPCNEKNRDLAEFRANSLAAIWNRLTAILVSDSLVPLVETITTARAQRH